MFLNCTADLFLFLAFICISIQTLSFNKKKHLLYYAVCNLELQCWLAMLDCLLAIAHMGRIVGTSKASLVPHFH